MPGFGNTTRTACSHPSIRESLEPFSTASVNDARVAARVAAHMQSNSRLAVPLFLVLGFALSWYPWALHALSYSGNPNPNPLGLLVGALIAAAVNGGWRESAAILKAIVRVRAEPGLWFATLAIPVAALAIAATIVALSGVAIRPTPSLWLEQLDRFLFTLVFIGLGEEPAWRCFLQPTLQRRLSVLGGPPHDARQRWRDEADRGDRHEALVRLGTMPNRDGRSKKPGDHEQHGEVSPYE
jgi:hypothetical protein